MTTGLVLKWVPCKLVSKACGLGYEKCNCVILPADIWSAGMAVLKRLTILCYEILVGIF